MSAYDPLTDDEMAELIENPMLVHLYDAHRLVAALATIATLRAALDEADGLIGELAGVVHQTDSLRSHADPNDHTGWNLHGIETCADPLCMDALAWRAALATAKDVTK